MLSMKCLRQYLVVGLMWWIAVQATSSTDDYYTAGIVEFRQSNASTLVAQLEDNLAAYLEILASSAAVGTDIIVFPEGTLNRLEQPTFVPDPVEQKERSLCNNQLIDEQITDEFMVKLACQARQYSKYVVVNVVEKEPCATSAQDPRPCAANGLNIFNTNVVFDRQGVVISRYRKVHLYGELKNTTFQPELGIFDTDFGVRFGHFVCFDILFYAPAQAMVDHLGITDFIFTTKWFSQLPFLTGVQVQAAWAFGNNVNLLAAGASAPIIGNTGSGVYAGRNGPLVAIMNLKVGERTLYVANVTKVRPQRVRRALVEPSTVAERSWPNARLNPDSDLFLKRDYLQNYESVLLDFDSLSGSRNSLEREVCYNGSFCCRFELTFAQLQNATSGSRYYTYRLGAYAGLRNPVASELNTIRNCALFTCVGEDIMDCGQVFPQEMNSRLQPKVAIERLVIEADFPKTCEFLVMPNSLTDDMMPVPVQNFEWTFNDTETMRHVRSTLNTSTDNLLAFAVYGNYFDTLLDPKPCGGGASDVIPMSVLVLVLNCIWLMLIAVH